MSIKPSKIVIRHIDEYDNIEVTILVRVVGCLKFDAGSGVSILNRTLM